MHPFHAPASTFVHPHAEDAASLFSESLPRMFKTPPPGVHPLVWAARIGAAFLAVRPFRDGNERRAMLLVNAVLMLHGIPVSLPGAHDGARWQRAAADIAFDDMFGWYELVLEGAERPTPTMRYPVMDSLHYFTSMVPIHTGLLFCILMSLQ